MEVWINRHRRLANASNNMLKNSATGMRAACGFSRHTSAPPIFII
jgi:hypothetical protein